MHPTHNSFLNKHLEGSGSHSTFSYALRALGKGRLPEQIDTPGGPWFHTRTVKHDFFAVTGIYHNSVGQQAVLKMGRTASFMGFPLRSIGRWLCCREVHFYKRLADIPNIPAFLSLVADTGFLHAYIPGRPLQKDKPVPDGFFAELQNLFNQLHERQIAYVDANKPENILLGDDNHPYLIDFQISWDLHGPGNTFINRWLLKRLQREDTYHILKHKKRLRPDELLPGEEELATRKSWPIRLHRFITRPYFIIRRAVMHRLQRKGKLLPEGSK